MMTGNFSRKFFKSEESRVNINIYFLERDERMQRNENAMLALRAGCFNNTELDGVLEKRCD